MKSLQTMPNWQRVLWHKSISFQKSKIVGFEKMSFLGLFETTTYNTT
jgi:hypothetical protein